MAGLEQRQVFLGLPLHMLAVAVVERNQEVEELAVLAVLAVAARAVHLLQALLEL
jgi:hypothetical protein